jgi:LytS/YehU family sensor histidine kinase
VSLKLELEYIRKYIYFQRLRLPPNTTLNYEFRGNAEKAKIAPLILIPFIENAFKYGVSTHIPSTIDITIERKGEMLYMKVDNRKIVPEGEAEGTHVGIRNIKKRLALIYPDKHILNIRETEDSYSIELSLSLGVYEPEKGGNED